jgi:hypothetical protein
MAVSLDQLAQNQVLFREVNERLRETLDVSVGAMEFLCECSDTDCTETISLDIAEYELVRSRSNQFVLTPGHEIPEIDRVVSNGDRYFLVEKIQGADYAERTDPRQRGKSQDQLARL